MQKNSLLLFKRVGLFVILLTAFQPGYGQLFQFRHYALENGYSGYGSVQFAQDSLGFLWIRSLAGLHQFDGFDFKTKSADPIDSLSLPYNLPYHLTVDPLGRVWVSFQHYLRVYERNIDGFKTYDQDSDVLSVSFDESGKTVWIGTSGKGLNRLDLETNKVIAYHNDLGNPSFHANVNSILGIRNCGANLLVATRRGLWLFNITTGHFSKLGLGVPDSSVVLNSEIQRIFKHKDCYWLQTVTGLVRADSNFRVIEKFKFQTICEKFDASRKLADPKITEIDQDANGIFWMASNGLGLIRYDPHNGSLKNFRHDPNDPLSIFSDELIALMVDREQNIWVGESPKGIGILINQRLTFYNYFSSVSLNIFKLTIKSIHEYKTGRLWIYSSQGVFCYDRQTKFYMRFSEDERVQAARFSRGTKDSVQNSIGTEAFFPANWNSVFDPSYLFVNTTNPRPVITGLKINDKKAVTRNPGKNEITIPQDINLLSELLLNHEQNAFSLEFASMMDLAEPERNHYRYKLEGFDKEWIDTDWKNRTATYMNLDPAKYVFKVKASNEAGVWSERERIVGIRILPPPWRTWWAYALYSLLFIGLLLIARRNIIQRERLTSKLELERIGLEKALEVDRLKSAFFTNISHEFRTPLTLIKGPAQTLAEEFAGNPRVVDKLKVIGENADHLLKLINQLLELAGLESGNVKIELTEGNLTTFINRTAQTFSSHAVQKGINYDVQTPVQNFIAKFDQGKVEAIALNLIANALKFTKPGGTVFFKAEVEKNKDDCYHLAIRVTDSGVGISKNDLDHIFERFYQASSFHREAGTGIGLALVKDMTELLGGTVRATSEVGIGSEFSVILPVEILKISANKVLTDQRVEEESPPVPEKRDELNLEHAGKPKVLVVEDNDELRHYIIETLGEEYDFLEAENGKVGLDLALKEIPEMIISDVMMPELDGVEMTYAIKKDIRTSHIPVILLTAKATEADKLSGLNMGAGDYLTKPFSRSELVLKVKNSLALQLRLREKVREEIEQASTKTEILSVDDRFLAKVKSAILNRISDEQLSVESLAEEIGMSRVQLYRKLSAITGLSVIELIREYRLQHAAKLLEKGASVSQTAFEIGFSDSSHFSRLFKDKFGVFPSSYPRTQG